MQILHFWIFLYIFAYFWTFFEHIVQSHWPKLVASSARNLIKKTFFFGFWVFIAPSLAIWVDQAVMPTPRGLWFAQDIYTIPGSWFLLFGFFSFIACSISVKGNSCSPLSLIACSISVNNCTWQVNYRSECTWWQKVMRFPGFSPGSSTSNNPICLE